MPKTILHITDVLSMGGTEVLLKNTIPALKEYNHIIVYLHGANEFKGHFAEIPVYCIEHTGKLAFLRSVKRFRKIIKKNKVDIIHSHLLWSGFIARLAKPKGVRLISSIHSVLSKDAFEKNRLSLWMEKLTANRQDDVIGVSQYVINDYLKFVSYKGKTHLLYNFIPAYFYRNVQFDNNQFNNKSPIRCVAVGGLKDVKNYSYILEAFAKLPAGSFELDIIGEGQLRNTLQQFITLHQLPIRLLGSKNAIQEILPDYQLFIQASKYEGFGLAIAEAVASGLFPILSDIPVHREITINEALYFDLASPDNLTDLLLTIKNESVNSTSFNTLREQIKKITDPENYLRQLREIYNA